MFIKLTPLFLEEPELLRELITLRLNESEPPNTEPPKQRSTEDQLPYENKKRHQGPPWLHNETHDGTIHKQDPVPIEEN